MKTTRSPLPSEFKKISCSMLKQPVAHRQHARITAYPRKNLSFIIVPFLKHFLLNNVSRFFQYLTCSSNCLQQITHVTSLPCSGAICSTVSLSLCRFSYKFTVKTFGVAGGGALTAPGVNTSASINNFSLGMYAIMMPSLCRLPLM